MKTYPRFLTFGFLIVNLVACGRPLSEIYTLACPSGTDPVRIVSPGFSTATRPVNIGGQTVYLDPMPYPMIWTADFCYDGTSLLDPTVTSGKIPADARLVR